MMPQVRGLLTNGRGLLDGFRRLACGNEVLVNQVQEHGGHILLPSLVPVAVDRQPVAEVLRLLA